MPLNNPTEPTFRARSTVTFTGAAGAGAVGAVTVFTVTGRVLVHLLVLYCTTSLTGASATISLGQIGNVELMIVPTTATGIDAGFFWVDSVPDGYGVDLPTGMMDFGVDDNIVFDVLVAGITAGVIVVDCWYSKLTDGAILA